MAFSVKSWHPVDSYQERCSLQD